MTLAQPHLLLCMLVIKCCPQSCTDRLLAHNFKVVHAAKFSICDVCQKGFTGFMKQSTKCVGKFLHKQIIRATDIPGLHGLYSLVPRPLQAFNHDALRIIAPIRFLASTSKAMRGHDFRGLNNVLFWACNNCALYWSGALISEGACI